MDAPVALSHFTARGLRRLNILPTEIEGMCIIEPRVFDDARGFLLESYNERAFNEALGLELRFVQENHSRSLHGVLRGLHYQLPPHAQGKLVRVTRGAVFDVAVDLRRSSPSYRRWVGLALTDENRRMVWLPPGLAHGFLVTSESADCLYLCTSHYHQKSESCLRWNDPQIGIAWPKTDRPHLMSSRDAAAPLLAEAPTFD